jgi:hypothetical protein
MEQDAFFFQSNTGTDASGTIPRVGLGFTEQCFLSDLHVIKMSHQGICSFGTVHRSIVKK